MANNVLADAELTRLRVALSFAFTPSVPVSDIDLFAGRSSQITQTLAAVGQRGRHVILYGERGVGKTSLAGLVHQFWATVSRTTDLLAVRYDRTPIDTFQSIWSNIAELLIDEFDKRGFAQPGSSAWQELIGDMRAGEATPHSVRRLLDMANKTLIIVIDEFNQIRHKDTTLLFSSTIKTLSDQAVDATFVLVGVAASVDELIADHESISRALAQVFMPRMKIDEVEELLTKGYERAGMLTDEGIIRLLAKLAQGLPHYGHRFGQEAGLAAVERRSRKVEHRDVAAAIERAVALTERSIRAAYQRATYSPQTKTAKYREVLLACALANSDDQGYFAAGSLRDPLFRVTGKRWNIPQYVNHLKKFSGPAKGPVLQMTGEDWLRSYRFIDPLLRAYVVLRGMEDQQIEEADLDRFVHRLGEEPSKKPDEQQNKLL